MATIREMYEELQRKKQNAEREVEKAEKRLLSFDSDKQSIVIKSIRGRLYYYAQWREKGKVHSRFIAPVTPGAVAEEEKVMIAIEQNKKMIKELRDTIKCLSKMLDTLEKHNKKEPFMDSFTFEVYWKDEITARVYVKSAEVVVSRFTDNPLKQLFASNRMTRYQLGMVMQLRCWEEGRADSKEKLDYLGLSEYNPYEIVRKTHGVSYNDYIWFRFPGEKLTSQDVLVR